MNTEVGRADSATALSGDGDVGGRNMPVFLPRTDIYETEDNVTLVMDIPGVPSDAVDVSVEQQQLTVRAQIRPEQPEGYRLVHAEYGEGRFERQFTLPDRVDLDAIDADCKNGVLTVTLTKSPEARPRRIKINAE